MVVQDLSSIIAALNTAALNIADLNHSSWSDGAFVHVVPFVDNYYSPVLCQELWIFVPCVLVKSNLHVCLCVG